MKPIGSVVKRLTPRPAPRWRLPRPSQSAIAVAALAFLVCGPPRPVDSRAPPLPYEDVGACPFECCTYRAWTAAKATELRASRSASAPVVASLEQGEPVTGVTGVVVTRKVGWARVAAPLEVEGREGEPAVALRAGDVVAILHYEGEGSWLCWIDGRLLSLGFLETPGSFSTAEQIERESVRVESWPEDEWWVKVKSSRGLEGWTNETDHFAHVDACE